VIQANIQAVSWCVLTEYHPQISTTKGTGGDLIVLEEAAYVDPGFFYVSFFFLRIPAACEF
jgi:hypothetical protein